MDDIEKQIYDIIDTKDTYIGEAPLDKSVCQWIKQSGGRSKVHYGKDTYDYLHYSIVIRGISNEETLQRSKIIYDKIKNYTGNSFSIIINRTLTFVGRDIKDRSVYSFQIEYQMGGY